MYYADLTVPPSKVPNSIYVSMNIIRNRSKLCVRRVNFFCRNKKKKTYAQSIEVVEIVCEIILDKIKKRCTTIERAEAISYAL